MKLNISHFGSNDWFNYKADIIYGLYHAFKRLSFEVTISHNNLSKNIINIIVGADWLGNLKFEQVKQITNNYKYCIYEVEHFDGKTINNRLDFNLNHYLEIINHSILIFTPYKYEFNIYKKFTEATNLLYCKWAYYDEVKDANIVRSSNYEWDAVFFGLVKGERINKINLISKKLNIVVVGTKIPHSMRSYYLSSSKYGLIISSGINEKFVNPFRIGVMLGNEIPVYSDKNMDDDNYLQYSNKLIIESKNDKVQFEYHYSSIKWKDSGNLSDSLLNVKSALK